MTDKLHTFTTQACSDYLCSYIAARIIPELFYILGFFQNNHYQFYSRIIIGFHLGTTPTTVTNSRINPDIVHTM